MTLRRYEGRCPECGHDHDAENAAFRAAISPSSERTASTVRREPQDVTAWAYLVRASGEGSTDYKLCRSEAEVRAAYVEMVTGDETGKHKGEVDDVMDEFRNDEEWSGDLLRIELYCAVFEVTRFPSGALA